MKRQFSPYEQNQLRRYGISIGDAEQCGNMPVEYITGHCEFYGRDFFVDKRVLIPRVEEEDFIRLALQSAVQMPLSLADVGTGSGILGITLFKELTALGRQPTAYLSDISEDALRVTKKNTERLIGKMYYNSSGRIGYNILLSDLFSIYPSDLKFDLVVANLPYIPSSRINTLPSSVKDFEPRLALGGGPDGLTLINRLLTQLPARLKPHGVAILEIDETHKLTDFPKMKKLRYKINKDQFGKSRFLVVQFVP